MGGLPAGSLVHVLSASMRSCAVLSRKRELKARMYVSAGMVPCTYTRAYVCALPGKFVERARDIHVRPHSVCIHDRNLQIYMSQCKRLPYLNGRLSATYIRRGGIKNTKSSQNPLAGGHCIINRFQERNKNKTNTLVSGTCDVLLR